MIGKLKGRPEKYPDDNKIILWLYGVGYLISTVDEIESDEVEFYIHEIVKETENSLVGFIDYSDLEYFRLLLSINGIGTVSALLIMREYSLEEVKTNPECISSIKGVGNKTLSAIKKKLC